MPVGFFDDPSFRWAQRPTVNLSSAQKAHASIIHVLADWSQIAKTKPASPLNGDDPAYDLSDLDAIVETAPRYNMQILMTISGTPKWANGGKTPNVPPTNLGNLTQFAHMLAARYNGLRPGFGAVSRWSIWNEPNLELFLKPQFQGSRIVSPQIYAKLYLAGYRGIKAGNPLADVAIGETSNRGRNKPLAGVSGSVAPATFAYLLSRANPRLPFSAWATHPYATDPWLPPNQKVAYPNVTMTRLEQFGKSLEQWFNRRVPIWVTEYAHQTKPEFPAGVTRAQQAANAKLALQMAAANPYVEMFIWFILRDSTELTWRSGLITKTGTKKPAYFTFSGEAKKIDGQSQIVVPGKNPTIKVDVPYLTWYNAPGARVGITYRVYDGKKLLYVGQPTAKLAPDQTVSFVAKFRPVKGKTYSVLADISDRGGQHSRRTVFVTVA
ncbi:MAG TPA: glycosyl hydrolase [Gaiellaceae bacterium]